MSIQWVYRTPRVVSCFHELGLNIESAFGLLRNSKIGIHNRSVTWEETNSMYLLIIGQVIIFVQHLNSSLKVFWRLEPSRRLSKGISMRLNSSSNREHCIGTRSATAQSVGWLTADLLPFDTAGRIRGCHLTCSAFVTCPFHQCVLSILKHTQIKGWVNENDGKHTSSLFWPSSPDKLVLSSSRAPGIGSVAGGICDAVPAQNVFAPMAMILSTMIWMLSNKGNLFVCQIFAFWWVCVVSNEDMSECYKSSHSKICISPRRHLVQW